MRLALDIRPIDTLFFRDARPFEQASQASTGLPTPQTLAGALRTTLLERHGIDWDRVADGVRRHGSVHRSLTSIGHEPAAVAAVSVRGPWIRRRDEVLLPVPANLRKTNDGPLIRLDPLRSELPGWRPHAPGMLPLWRYGRKSMKALKPDTFIRPEGQEKFLHGSIPDASTLVQGEDLYQYDVRTGIGMDAASGTVSEGLIYSAQHLVLRQHVSFYAEVAGSERALSPLLNTTVLMRFGGEGRCVQVSASKTLYAWPGAPGHTKRGKLLLLTTPVAVDGWKSAGLDLISAAVGKPRAVSGWDMALGGPKPNRFMVPAGTVYFLSERARVPSCLGSEEDSQIGWGHFLEGIWSYV